MLRTCATLVSLTLALPVFAGEWWDPAWEWRRQIDLNTDFLAEDLNDFPLSLYLHDGGHLTEHAQNEDRLRDLRVVNEEGQVLDVYQIGWEGDHGEIHLRVPRIAAGAGVQHLYLYYGNPSAEFLSSPVKPWQDHYLAVSHFQPSSNFSRTGGEPLTPQGEVHALDPKTGDQLLPGDRAAYFTVDPELLKGIGEQMTVSLRVRFEDNPGLQTIVSGIRADAPEEWLNFGLKTPDTLHTNATSNGQRAGELNITGLKPGQWHGVVARYDARNHTRTLCIDGVEFGQDTALPGPLRLSEMRVGRGVLHFESWQLHGALREFRLADIARSDSWVRAEAAALSDHNPFYVVGPVHHRGDPAPAPQPFALLAPADGLQHKKRAPLALSWTPSAGAERYSIFFYDHPEDPEPFQVIDAGARTSFTLSRGDLKKAEGYWTVVAQSASGGQPADARRKLSFYDWNAAMEATPPADAIIPALRPVPGDEYRLSGYLSGRIDRVIQRYFLETPESSPAILQVLRDRDKRPVRDPLVPWAGEFAGKFLTAAELTWRLTGDAALKTTIDQFAKDLIACQAENGYLGPFPAESRLTGGNWDIWGHYHCILGLLLYYEDTQYAPALEACEKAADLLFETFGPGGPALTNDGSGGEMNMSICHGLVLLYKKTGKQRYLDLAKYVVHEAWNSEGAGHYLDNALAGKPLIEFPRHRWESMHDWMALAELYWLTGDEQYRKAFEHLWHECRKDRHNTGGITSGEGFVGTAFNTGAIETCCTVAWIAMSIEMLKLTGDNTIADEIEWSTLNSALGAIPYSGRSCAYNVPMDGTRVFGVELPWQAPKAGPDLNCCAVNANRPLGMISQWGLLQDNEGLVLNFYGPGMYVGELPDGNQIVLYQETEYPAEGGIGIRLSCGAPETFTLKLRIPQWSTNTTLSVNGEAQSAPQPGTYAALRREWKTDDVIKFTLDFTPRTMKGEESFADKVSVFRGPIVFAFDGRYSDLNPDQLPPLDPVSLAFTPAASEGAMPPWLHYTLSDATGTSYPVLDLSSAGQTGNHYRTWLPVTP